MERWMGSEMGGWPLLGWWLVRYMLYRGRACLKRRRIGGRPVSANRDVVGVVLKALRIQWAAEYHTALMGRRSTSRWKEIEAP